MATWIHVEDVNVREGDKVFVVGAAAAYPHYKQALLSAQPALCEKSVVLVQSARELLGLRGPVVHMIFGFEDLRDIQEIALTARMRQAQISLVKY